MKSIASLLQNKQFQSPVMRGVTAARVVACANQILQNIFGAVIQEHAQAIYLKNNFLGIACLSSTVAQEIRLQEPKIIEAINQKSGASVIKKIRYES